MTETNVAIYQNFSNFMRALTSFVTVLEFLIGVEKFSGLLMHKKCDYGKYS